jgi:Mrp family chromosome partitioning ATPase
MSMRTATAANVAAVAPESGHPIRNVLVLDADANNALAALLYDLDSIRTAALNGDIPGFSVASNQFEALVALRGAAYGV